MKLACISLTAVAAMLAVQLASSPISNADTIILKNGASLHGAARREDGKVVIEFGKKGRMALPEAQVEKIVEDDLDAFELRGSGPSPAEDGRLVTVTLKEGADKAGRKTWTGRVVPSTDDRVLTLGLPEGGTVAILREQIESTSDAEEKPAPADVDPAERRIATTHVVTLKNGRTIKGNVLETRENEPVEVAIGPLGVIRIPRDEIETIEAVDGSYELPPPPEPVEDRPTVEIPAEVIRDIRAELREELLRELLDRIIEEQMDEVLRQGARDLSFRSIIRDLGSEEILDIQFYVRELGRHRNTNRVRAENYLKRYGYRSLPFLEAAANHPFDLTRRAVQRIVKSADDLRGVPYAIEGLNDSDIWVRRLAYDAVTYLLGDGIEYSPDAPAWERVAAQKKYRRLWNEVQLSYLRELAYRGY